MSIFGELDAKEIPNNPFFIPAGEYSGVVSGAEIKEDRTGQLRLNIEYTISDDNAYHGKTVRDSFRIFPNLTRADFEMLQPKEKSEISSERSRLKQRLCGDPAFDDPGLGVNPEDLNDDNWDPKSLVGTLVDLTITNSADGRYTNVRTARIVE